MTTVLDYLVPHFAVDVVGVFDKDFNQVFPRARVLKASVKEDSKVMEHPLETGSIITDHRIVLPVEIELYCILQSADYADTYKIVKQYFLNGTLLTVQTRSGSYANQLMASLPHTEDAEQYDTLLMTLNFKQVQFATGRFRGTPANPSNSSTQDRGVINPQTPSQTSQGNVTNSISG